jgi:HlyD family secretion protein
VTYQNLQSSEDASLASSQKSGARKAGELSSGAGNYAAESQLSSQLSIEASDEAGSPEKKPSGESWAGRGAGWLGGGKGLLLGLALGLGLAFIGTRVSQRKPTLQAATPSETSAVASASVTTAQAKQAPIKETIAASGTVQAFDLLSVSPRASGLQIQAVNVRQGDRVSAGQVLAVLDDSVLRAQIDQAQAEVTAAEAAVAQAEAAAAQAEATAAEAQDKFDRYNDLFAKGAISEEELETRRTQFSTAQQEMGSAIASIDSAQATVRSRKAEVDQLYTQLGQTAVLAPTDGIIAKKSATVGDTATAGTPLFELISGDQLELALSVPQAQMAKVREGASVQITSSADANLQLQGQIRSIDPTVDAQSRKATVNVSLPGSDRLRPGMYLQAAIVTGTRQGVVVPAAAVLPQSSGGFIVYTVDGQGLAKAQPVEVGERTLAAGKVPAQIEITSGLLANATVVVEGASYLQDGDKVDVVGN